MTIGGIRFRITVDRWHCMRTHTQEPVASPAVDGTGMKFLFRIAETIQCNVGTQRTFNCKFNQILRSLINKPRV